MFKSYIWTLPTRVFHASFALLILIAYFTSEDDLITIHAIAGYLLLVPFTFRIGWGFIGPKYSRFKDFNLNPKKAKEFALNIFKRHEQHVGHNPAASIVMFLMIVLIPFIVFTGMLALGAEESKGLFAFLERDKIFKGIHEIFVNLIVLSIIAHLAGVFLDKILNNEEGTLMSIFKGYKNTKNEEIIKLNIFQKIYSIIFLGLFIAFAIYLIFISSNILIH